MDICTLVFADLSLPTSSNILLSNQIEIIIYSAINLYLTYIYSKLLSTFALVVTEIHT